METALEPKTELIEAPKTDAGNLALITIDPEKYAATLYAPFHAKLVLSITEAEAAKTGLDMTTTAGMATAVKHRAVFRDDFRIASEKIRVQRKAPILTIGGLIDAGAKKIKDAVAPHEKYWDDLIEVEVKRKKEETAAKIAADRARIEAIQITINVIRAIPSEYVRNTAEQIQFRLNHLRENKYPSDDYDFMEFADVAAEAMREAVERLEELHADAVAAEAETARLAAERKAEDERRAAGAIALREQQAELARQQAELDRKKAEQQAQVAEQKRIADAWAAAEALKALQAQQAAQAELKAAQDKFNADMAQARAETARQAAEAQRVIDEAARVQREAQEAADALVAAEDERKRVEAQHIANAVTESARDKAEEMATPAQFAPEPFPFPGTQAASDLAHIEIDIGEDGVDYIRGGDMWDMFVSALRAALPLIDGADEHSADVRGRIERALVAAGEMQVTA